MSEFMWTAERQAELIALAGAGKSAGEVGRIFGVTRNAVLGRAFRTGVKFHGFVAATPKPPRAPRDPAAPRPRRRRAAREFFAARNQEVRRLYLEGITLSEISRLTGAPMGSIPTLVRALPRRRVFAKGVAKTREFRVMAIAATLSGKSQAKVAATLGFDKHCFTYWKHDPAVMADAEAVAVQVRAEMKAKADARRAEAAARKAAEKARRDEINAPILAALNDRARAMMVRRINGETLEAIGATYGVTRERVRQIEVACRLRGLQLPNAKPLTEAAQRASYNPVPRKAASAKAARGYTITEQERNRRRAAMAQVARAYWDRRQSEARA